MGVADSGWTLRDRDGVGDGKPGWKVWKVRCGREVMAEMREGYSSGGESVLRGRGKGPVI